MAAPCERRPVRRRSWTAVTKSLPVKAQDLNDRPRSAGEDGDVFAFVVAELRSDMNFKREAVHVAELRGLWVVDADALKGGGGISERGVVFRAVHAVGTGALFDD